MFYNTLTLESEMEVKMLLEKGKMITNDKGISYYQIGRKYYSNTGWLEREITKSEFEQKVKEAIAELNKSMETK